MIKINPVNTFKTKASNMVNEKVRKKAEKKVMRDLNNRFGHLMTKSEPEESEIRISLSERMFEQLIKGEVVELEFLEQTVKICLQDIGYYRMEDIILKAINEYQSK